MSGQVLEVGDGLVVLTHADLPDVAAEGVDLFAIREPLEVEIGATIEATLRGSGGETWLHRVRATGTAPLPEGFVAGGHALTGTVVRVDDDGVVLDHDLIRGVMPPMVMPFEVRYPPLLEGLSKGDRVQGRLLVVDHDFWIVELDEVADGELELRTDVPHLLPTQVLPRLEVPVVGGDTAVLGEDQGVRTALSFVYTRCPDPDFCPATIARLQGLQAALDGDARILTVTLDPEHDTLEVLGPYAELAGAVAPGWQFARIDDDALQVLAMRAGMEVTLVEGKIAHQLRLLVLDADGRLIERYDDNAWPLDRVVKQLRSGVPLADPGTVGTLSEPVPDGG